MQQLRWMKSIDGKWLNLEKLDLTNVHSVGVYMVWHGGSNPRIVRVGQGNIAARLTAHRLNHQIMRFSGYGALMVTWAEVADENTRLGIERYMANQFKPIIKDRLPEVYPLMANSPFA